MSTGYECTFREVEPGQWYYLLQRGDCPVGAFDWREYAECFGPFTSEEKAEAHLSDNHANPGGWSTHSYRPGDKIDEVWAKHIEHAKRHTQHGPRWMRSRGGWGR